MHSLDLSRASDRILPKMLRSQALANGDADYLITDEARYTFAQTEDIANSLAGGLQSLGVGKGDRVAFFMGNCAEMVLLAFAANKLGAIWTPINVDYKGDWLLDTLLRCRSKVLVTDTQLLGRISAIRDQLAVENLVLVGDGEQMPADGALSYGELASHTPVIPDYSNHDYGDSCAILWTSGTTGKSKGVLQSHNCWIRAIWGASKQFRSQEGDVIYCPLPLYNTAAWNTAIYRGLVEGLPVVIEKKFSVSHFMERIAHFGATQTYVIGAMGVFLWNTPESDQDREISLRAAGIVPMPPEIWDGFEQRFGLRVLRAGFGMSEIQVVMSQFEDRDDVPRHALGFAIPDIEVRLCDHAGIPVAPGQPGEICIRPLQPHVLFNGYFDDPEATAAAYRGEWFLTGDMARQDPATGAYFFVDRKKDAVRFAGRNISSMEVEGVVRKHPAVREVAAYGIPSSEISSEDELKIDVVLKQGETLDAEQLCEFINSNAPYFFVPRYLDFVTSLPYTPTNKVQKFKLRDKGVTDSTWDLQASNYVVQK